MTLFIVSVTLVLTVSAICSLAEAAVYAVRMPYVKSLADSGSRAGTILGGFKANMEQPISAILILNTVANTAGAAVAGAQARLLFGEASLLWFSAFFTLGVLFFSEIIPKVIGVVYNRPIATILAAPLSVVVTALYPLVWVIQKLSALVKPDQAVMTAPEEEVKQLAMISAQEGSIMPYEAELVRNVLQLDRLTTRDLMTPRPVVEKVPSDMTLREVAERMTDWTYSRVPVYDTDDPETWVGFLLSKEVLAALAKDEFDLKVSDLAKPMFFVSEKTPGHILLKEFLKRRTHLFGATDEYGDITGIISLEDVLESIIGEEIVDEHDTSVDMQELARLRKRQQFGKGNLSSPSDGRAPDEPA